MKALLGIAFLSTAHALPVTLESDGSVPDRETLIASIAAAQDAEAAADATLIHYHQHGFPAIGVEVEDHGGQREVIINVARYDQIAISEGPARTQKVAARFFGSLAHQEIHQPRLETLLEDFHANPLHRVVPQLQPHHDQVNVLLNIEQSQAQRFSAGYHNHGASPLPRNRFWVLGEFSDLWSTSSLTSAQLTLASDPTDYHALQLGTRLFQPGGDELSIALSYSGASGRTLAPFDAFTWQVGAQWQRNERPWGNWKRRSSIGLSYRRSNNALEFGAAPTRGLADVIQFTLGQQLILRQEASLTHLNASLVGSPGSPTSAGDDTAHGSLRPGARSDYLLARVGLWHRHNLPQNWDLVFHLAGQWTSDPVLQADQIALGGASGLRGLPEQFALGDQGYLGGIEVRSPTITLGKQWKFRPSFFLQNGETFNLVTNTSTNATTAGIGLQFAKAQDLRASVHAGWRLDEGGSTVHTQLTWNF